MFFRRILVSFGRRLSRLFIKRRFIVGLLASVAFLAYFKSFLQFAPSEVSLTERLSTNIVGYRPSISTTKQQTPNDSGALNVHMWTEIGGTNVDLLRNWPHFPYIPDNRSFLTEFCKTQDLNLKNNGERIFGFVRPQKSGNYKFAITSDDTSELWLSPNEDPASSVMIARVYSPNSSAWTEQGDYNKYPQQISKEILLNAGKKYYIESLSKQGSGATHVAVYWSYENLTFEIISSKYLSSFSEYNTDERIPTHAGKQESIELRRKSSSYYFNRLPVINREEYLSLIPSCVYTPSFLVNGTIQKHSGVWRTIESESRIFPRDDTNMFQNRKDGWSKPNALIDKNTVESIVGLLMNALRSRKYILKKIYKVIQKPDPANGDRFLLNLELGFENSNQTWRLSEHVYQKKNDTTLCLPEGMNWNNNVTVYFILPVKDQGKWVHYFLSQLADASLLTGDTNFHVIIVDFESKDIDLRKALNTPVFRSRHTVLSLTGKFYKTLALNKAAELVPNAHDIIFLFDLHIDVPADIMDSVRMNTIAGRMAYFPVVGRLDQASSSVEHRGYWEKYGYGIMSIYKSDWDKFGGMNIEAFKYNWGGEDWDLVDRVVSTSMEVERIRYPGLYHHYHPKRKLWN